MGKMVARSSSAGRIKDAASKTLVAARARGGEIQAAAEMRLADVSAALDTNERDLEQARTNDDNLHAVLMARDEESDLEIGAVCDEMWNAMGRPAQSVDYDIIISGGKSVWTEGDPAKQPHLMEVLAGNIRNSKHPKLAPRKEEWASRIEKKAAAQAEAAAPTAAAYAKVTALTMQRRMLADTAQLGLTRLKRDLKNMGMTEAQVHEIIPEVTAGNGSPSTPPRPAPAPAPAAS
jgi:hypothetical protein